MPSTPSYWGFITVVTLSVLGQVTPSQQALRLPPEGETHDDDSLQPSSSSDPTETPAVAEALLGRMVMPAVPPSFPLVEFSDYGVQGQFMPSAPTDQRSGRPAVENRFATFPAGGRKTVIPGSIPVNAYHNPTTGLAEAHNARIKYRPRMTQGGGGGPSSHYAGGSSWGSGTGGGMSKSKLYGSITGGGFGGILDRSDPTDYFDYYKEESYYPQDSEGHDLNEGGKGTLHAALQTLWEHRDEAYHNVKDASSSTSNWLDDMRKGYRPSQGKSSSKSPGRPSTRVNPFQRAPPLEHPLRSKSGEVLQLGSTNSHHRPVNHNRNNPISRRNQSPIGRYPNSGGYHNNVLTTQRPTRTQFMTRVVTTKRPFPAVVRPGHQQGMPRRRVSGTKMVVMQKLGPSTKRGPGPGRNPAFNQRPVNGRRPFQMVRSRFPLGRIGTAAMGDSGVLSTTNTEEKAEEPLYITGISYEDYDTKEFPDFTGFPNNDVTGQTGSSGVMAAGVTGTQMRNQIAQNQGSLGTDAAFEKSDWMTQVSDVMSGVSNQLPSIDKAITSMSFMAFGIFMANLFLQAVVNSSFTSFLGRTDKADDSGGFNLDLANLPIDLDLEELDFINSQWKENFESGEGSLSMVKKLLKVMGQVYVSLHEIARAGIYNVVSALGLDAPRTRTPSGAEHLEPECLRRLLCEGHHITAPHFKGTSTYRLLPFWTFGVSWLSGNSNMPRLLEELRAEVAGQQGLPCDSLYPECTDTTAIEGFLEKIRSGVEDLGDGDDRPLNDVSGRVMVDGGSVATLQNEKSHVGSNYSTTVVNVLESTDVEGEYGGLEGDTLVIHATDDVNNRSTLVPMVLGFTQIPLSYLNKEEEEQQVSESP